MSSIPSGHPYSPRRVPVPRSVMMKDMASSSLEDLCFHINTKIANIKKCLLLRDIGKDASYKPALCKIQNNVILVYDLLNKMENEVKQQEKLRDLLKEMQKAAERDQKEAQHLLEHIPLHLPKTPQSSEQNTPDPITLFTPVETPCVEMSSCGMVRSKQRTVSLSSNMTPSVKEQTEAVECKAEKKPEKEKKTIKEAALITTKEFESVPLYMKGRLTYDQINAVVQELNKAVVGKYKIMCQPLNSMSAPVRELYHRFIDEETKDTKGAFFIVQEDIKAFTELKLDKRFHRILTILRHCKRVKETRSLGLIRYIIC